MKYSRITRVFRFEAAHQLPNHRGKCARLHGHSYRLEVTVRGPMYEVTGSSNDGMVMDFADLSQLVRESIVNRLDHQNLNEVTGVYTTAENLVHWMWDALLAAGLDEQLLYSIRLWETENSYAEITHAERDQS